MIRPDLLKLTETLGRIFLRLIGLSWRVRYIRPPTGRAGRVRGKPALFAFWHGRQLPLVHTHRNEQVSVLVSKNRDGQYATNVLHSMGFRTIRGSSSRGGVKALSELALTLKNGIDCAITPDGPRGPAQRAKNGIAQIARRGNRPLVPVGASGWPVVRLSSWDSFIVPLPFARVTVVEGAPLISMKEADDPREWIERVESELNRVTSLAELFSLPSTRFISRVLRFLGNVMHPVSSIFLIFRPRRERRERKGHVNRPNRKPVWMHGSSLGELNGLVPYAKYLKDRGVPVWITCFTPSGRSFIERMGFDGSFIPLDVPRFLDRFICRVKPRAFILAETEIWPNTILKTLETGIPCMMINARLSEKSLRGYSFLGNLPGDMLSCFTGILARSEEDSNRFVSMGVDERIIRVSGDSKVLTDHGDPPPEWRRSYNTDKPVLIAGSTRDSEEEIILQASLSAGYFPVIAPRHINRVNDILNLMHQLGFKPVKWSQLADMSFGSNEFDSVVVDRHGVLSRIYGSGDVAFVGGTFVPMGGHNVIEPPMRGVPFIVGPDYSSFTEIVDKLVVTGIAYIASSHEEMVDILNLLRNNPVNGNRVRMEFESTKRNIIADFAGMIRKSGITENTDEQI